MPENKAYAKWTLEELLAEEKKIKKRETLAAGIIGFLIGIIVYGVATSGSGFLYIAIPLVLIYGIYKGFAKAQTRVEASTGRDRSEK